jgi:hypothetical protein
MPDAQRVRKWVSEWLGLILGVALIAFGLWSYWKIQSPFVRGLAEPALIAGILTVTVDPFLKRRLLKGASQDIFHHMLGFGLPDEIKERIKKIALTTNVYRKDMEIDCDFIPIDDGVRIDFEYKFWVVNPSNSTIKFSQYFEFENQEQAVLTSISCSDRKGDYGKHLALNLRADDELMIYKGPPVNIPPEKPNHRISFRARFSITRHLSDFHPQYFTHPTIGFTLRIRNHPSNLRITASPADSTLDNEWIYNRLFMPGDHIEMRWEKT